MNENLTNFDLHTDKLADDGHAIGKSGKRVTVYCGTAVGKDPDYLKDCTRLATWIGKSGHTLVFGGSNRGLMLESANTVKAYNSPVIAVEPDVPFITKQLCEGMSEVAWASSMHVRRNVLRDLGDIVIALPGGVGTFAEVMDTLESFKIGEAPKPMILFNTNHYYDYLYNFIIHSIEQGFSPAYFKDYLYLTDSLNELDHILENLKKGEKPRYV